MRSDGRGPAVARDHCPRRVEPIAIRGQPRRPARSARTPDSPVPVRAPTSRPVRRTRARRALRRGRREKVAEGGSAGQAGVRRRVDHRARGAGGGPQAARHVHRLDRRARPAPPGVGGRRQRGRRGAGRLLRHHRRGAARRRRGPGHRQRPWLPGRPAPQAEEAGRRGGADRAARGRQVRRQGVRGLRRSARRRRLRGQRALHPDGRWRSTRTASSGGSSTPTPSPARWRRARRPTAPAPAVTFWPDPTIFETVDFDFETIYRRLQEMAFLNRGLTIHLRDERVPEDEDGKPREVTFCYKGGIADFVRHLNADQDPDPQVGGRVRRRGRGHVGRDRHAVERVVRRVGLHLRQHDQHARGRHPRGGLPGRADQRGQQVRRRQEAAQGRREALRRGHPRGPGRDHLGQAGQPAVRGPDQDQARQHRR